MASLLDSEKLGILGEHVAAGDRIGYYSQLAEWGYAYAELALAVVESSTVTGRTANAYFLDQAADEGVAVSKNDMSRISLALMSNGCSATCRRIARWSR